MKKIIYILSIFMALASCQEEGEPLTIEAINELNNVNDKKFSATINGQDFKTNESEAIFYNGQLTINSINRNSSVSVSAESIEEGIYMGINNSGKNVVNYLDASGTLFSSTKPNVDSELVVEITKYNQSKKTISGKVYGKLHAPWNETIDMVNGKFSNVSVEIPFTGEMTADIGTESYKSSTCIFSSASSSGFTIETIVSSARSDTVSITFTIEEKIREKSYNLASDPLTARYNSNSFSTDVFKNAYTGKSGVLNITSIDTVAKRIKGSFNFKADNFLNEEVEIENGAFNAVIR